MDVCWAERRIGKNLVLGSFLQGNGCAVFLPMIGSLDAQNHEYSLPMGQCRPGSRSACRPAGAFVLRGDDDFGRFQLDDAAVIAVDGHVEAGPAGPKVEPTGWVGGITTQPLRSGRFLYTGWA